MTDPDVAPMVLVHGAWFGSWCWQHVEDELAERGIDTLAVDLPGRPANPLPLDKITLDVWVDSLAHVVDGLTGPCIVVGHSLAGAALTMLGERRPDSIERLVYVAAFLLRSGESATDVVRRDKRTQVHAARRLSDDLRSSTLEPTLIGTILCSGCTEEDRLAVQASVVPESTTVARTPVAWTEERFGTIPRSFIICERDRVIDPLIQRQMIVDVGCDTVERLDSGHSPFLSHPEQLSSLLASTAATSGAGRNAEP